MVFEVATRFSVVLALMFCAGCSVASPAKPDAVRSGTAVVRVTTNAHGQTIAAVMVKSSGSSDIDRAAVADTRVRWHGAASSTEDVTVKYTPGPDGRPTPTFRL